MTALRTNSAPMSRAVVRLANDQPAYTRRRSGYVTQALIAERGSFKAALEWLNEGRG